MTVSVFRPRPYQAEAIEGVRQQWAAGKRSTLIVMATGLGKTVTFSEIARRVLEKSNDGRVLVLAHRRELIDQAARTLYDMTGQTPGIEMADERADMNTMFRAKPRIVVASVQTLISGRKDNRRYMQFSPDEFRAVIVDEAHHAMANSYREIIDYFSQGSLVLGVTATPDRGDGEKLGPVFDSVAYDYGVRDAVSDGWLVPIRQRIVHCQGLDLSNVKTRAGDFVELELANILEQEENELMMVASMLEIVGDRRTLVFAANVSHAESIEEIINRHRPGQARLITGATHKQTRRAMLEDFDADEFQFLVNVGVATEGFDSPGVSAVVVMRPTKSRALYAQMIGRGTRPVREVAHTLGEIDDPDKRRDLIAGSTKPDVLVVDYKGNAGSHKLVHATDILGDAEDDQVIELANMIIEDSGGEMDVEDAIEQASEALAEKRAEEEAEQRRREKEREKRRGLAPNARYSQSEVDPFDILNITPVSERAFGQDRPPTERMIDALERMGVKHADSYTFAQAKKMLDNRSVRMKHKLCTYKQARLLSSYGINPVRLSMADATRMITELVDNGWKRPKGWGK